MVELARAICGCRSCSRWVLVVEGEYHRFDESLYDVLGDFHGRSSHRALDCVGEVQVAVLEGSFLQVEVISHGTPSFEAQTEGEHDSTLGNAIELELDDQGVLGARTDEKITEKGYGISALRVVEVSV